MLLEISLRQSLGLSKNLKLSPLVTTNTDRIKAKIELKELKMQMRTTFDRKTSKLMPLKAV
jgi:hypothetical protein